MAASSPAASNIGALPLDAIYEILLRLPAKLLCLLRAVCRPWRALLFGPQFAAAHSARHPDPLIVAGYAENEGNGMNVDIMDMSGQQGRSCVFGGPGRNQNWRPLINTSTTF
ncbi:hypothetical protein HU200_015924 [Digitaria exilis]|uniref:F-box domain-containing protein n=1 Tax=Digitaria exilis TaxID=1010633 RepID=A0A835F8X9_9POAL|nr:hypothetical protein HU200_015924 [Digitaria exilis]